MYYLYLLRCSDNSLYCGQTNNLKRRTQEHKLGKSRSAKYTKAFGPIRLVYFEKYSELSQVMKREAEIKSWKKAKKEALIKSKVTDNKF